jgi:hypothetical protein
MGYGFTSVSAAWPWWIRLTARNTSKMEKCMAVVGVGFLGERVGMNILMD